LDFESGSKRVVVVIDITYEIGKREQKNFKSICQMEFFPFLLLLEEPLVAQTPEENKSSTRCFASFTNSMVEVDNPCLIRK
jgi:hypothetical protein